MEHPSTVACVDFFRLGDDIVRKCYSVAVIGLRTSGGILLTVCTPYRRLMISNLTAPPNCATLAPPEVLSGVDVRRSWTLRASAA